MGRDAAVTYEQVAAAAEQMKAAGVKPTARALRERLGNSGSMGTVHKLLQTWRAGQESSSSAPAVPVSVQRAILEFVDGELARSRGMLEAELAEQRQEAADLAAENDRQAANLADQAGALTRLQAEVATLEGRMAQMGVELVAARDNAARERETVQTARIELATTRLQLEGLPRLEKDLATMRRDLEVERQGRVVAEQQAAVLTARLEAVVVQRRPSGLKTPQAKTKPAPPAPASSKPRKRG